MFDKLKMEVSLGLLRNLDLYFARQMFRLDNNNEHIMLPAALASHAISDGDVCLDLAAVAGTQLKDLKLSTEYRLEIPSLDELREALRSSRVVGSPGDTAPLILDKHDHLYLGRYWWFEKQVADALLARALPLQPGEVDDELLAQGLQRMFSNDHGETDWQRVAAAVAVLRRFSVISGGPGTGKTYTVTTILALLLEQSQDSKLRIALAAPTGKAAARLSESIRNTKPGIACSDTIKELIPEEASTIHRLLGIRPGQEQPRFNKEHPLHVDLLVVDEASMIDLPLMARLLAALPEHAKLILLGDKDQLASVEAGSIFADICGEDSEAHYTHEFHVQLQRVSGEHIDNQEPRNAFAESIALLHKSYRFSGEEGIGQLAAAVNRGDSQSVLQLFGQGLEDISLFSPREEHIASELKNRVLQAYAECFKAGGHLEALRRFNAFRILCAVRKGPAGVEQVNRTIEQLLRNRGLIRGDTQHYKGRLVMVTRNDYSVGLFNGDVGILWPDPDADNRLAAWFALPDDSMKRVLPGRLPPHETAYAMTVHKSQGSEFERVLVMLPFEEVGVVSRELLYTGITRAKHKVELWGSEAILCKAVEHRMTRVSGLSGLLHGARQR
ncbi:MAG: exodeoxyribonuclease V subunit alpha [Gammaproteobacteria bacterium]|nr:exodeoxyribonuclease V subunit alpha [Gammaproteobacteria bacterium]